MGKLSEDVDVLMYEEVREHPRLLLCDVCLNESFKKQQLATGDVLIFQASVGRGSGAIFPTVRDFLTHISLRRRVVFKDLSQPLVGTI